MVINNKSILVSASVLLVAGAVGYLVLGGERASRGQFASATEIPQPDLAKSELAGLPVAPLNQRVDIQKPTFSNPTKITHPLFPVNELKQAILLGHDDGRLLQVNYTLLPESKNRTISWDGKSIETRTVQYSAYFDRRLIETAYDWYAQADDGSVWYFGEDVFNYADGELTDTHGTWLAGRDGPVAMIMPANPKVGNVYRVENIPGVAFEEVEVKSVDATVEGPLGRVTGCMIATQLHDNGSYSDKTFCPGYGEFYTEKDIDLEAVALAVPADVLGKPVPTQLSTIMTGAENMYNSADKKDWAAVQNEFSVMKAAWNTFKENPDKVSTRLAAQMERALRTLEGDALEPSVSARHTIGTRNGAIDVLFAALDLELRYRPYTEVDADRIALFARKVLGDAAALEIGLVSSDVLALELLQERVLPTLDQSQGAQLSVHVQELRTATDAEDFEAATEAAKNLIRLFPL